MDVVYPILFGTVLVLLVYWFFSRRNPDLHPAVLPGLMFIKIGAGIGLFLIYYYYYENNLETSDTFRFFNHSLVFREAWKESPKLFFQLFFDMDGVERVKFYTQQMPTWSRWYTYGDYNDGRTLIRFNAVISLFSNGNYHIHSIVMNFISFIGLYLTYKAFEPIEKKMKYLQLGLLFALPSVLFWSSGVLKESILLLGLGLFLWGLVRFFQKPTLASFVVLLLGISLLGIIKSYVLMMLIPGIVSYIICKKWITKKPWLIFLVTHITLFILGMNLYRIGPNFNVQKMLDRKQQDFMVLSQVQGAKSAFDPPFIQSSAISILRAAPEGIFNTLFRPFPKDVNGPLEWLAVFENLLIIVLIAVLIYKSNRPSQHQTELLFALSFWLLLYALIGITAPISGAVVRYKIPALVLIFAVLCQNAKLFAPKNEKLR